MKTDFKERFGISMEQLSRITEIPYERIDDIMSGKADVETYSNSEVKRIKDTLEITGEELCSYIISSDGLKRSAFISDSDDNDSICTGHIYVEDSCFYLGLNVSDDQYDFCLCKANGKNAVSVCGSMDELFEYYVEQISEIYS